MIFNWLNDGVDYSKDELHYFRNEFLPITLKVIDLCDKGEGNNLRLMNQVLE